MEKVKVSRREPVLDLPSIRFEVDLDLENGTAFIMKPSGADACDFDVSGVVDVGRAVIEWLRNRGYR